MGFDSPGDRIAGPKPPGNWGLFFWSGPLGDPSDGGSLASRALQQLRRMAEGSVGEALTREHAADLAGAGFAGDLPDHRHSAAGGWW